MRIRYFAAARAAAGTDTEILEVPGHQVLSRRQVEALLTTRHPHPPPGQPGLEQVLARSSFLLDGTACPDPATEIPPEATLDVLPPFAGG